MVRACDAAFVWLIVHQGMYTASEMVREFRRIPAIRDNVEIED